MKNFFKKEPVLAISALCALLSMAAVPPSAAYLEYIDWKVLGLLFCLMAVVAGVQACGLFDVLAQKLLRGCGGLRKLRLMLVLLPFFTSMLITNDVALITFVPFAIAVLGAVGRKDQYIPVIVLQTVAANLGSMALPVGNPQSLFLYTKSGMGMGEYLGVLGLYAALSLVGIVAASLAVKETPIEVSFEKTETIKNKKLLGIYGILFLLAMLVVLRVLDYRLVTVIVLAALLIFDRKMLGKVDYMLLLTFICFFVFSGNLGGLDAVKTMLTGLLSKNAMVTSVLASQVISNVPAAVLLSAFTEDLTGLLIGTNLGGLGTIIASLASLISFKYYLRAEGASAGKYMIHFTIVNVIGLVILTAAALVLA
ncbi:MAG: citrate transporter [Clostridia bacterium]|nr:citrate transporter [Clostridia bacterium]